MTGIWLATNGIIHGAIHGSSRCICTSDGAEIAASNIARSRFWREVGAFVTSDPTQPRIQQGTKRSRQSIYVRQRCRTVTGMTTAEALRTQVKNNKNNTVRYTPSDLKYAIARKFVTIEMTENVNNRKRKK